MNSSAEPAGRKWHYGRSLKGMVPVVIGLAVLLGQSEAALAARRSGFDPFGDLFAPQRSHRTHRHATSQIPPAPAPAGPAPAVQATDVPLPQPRPAEAPAAAPQKPAAVASAPPAAKTEPDKKPEGDKKAEPDKKPESAKTTETDKKAAPDKPAEQGALIGPPAPQPSACRLALTEDIAIAPSIPAIHGPGACGGDDLVRLEAVVLADKRKVKLTPAATMRCRMASEIADWVRTDVAPIAHDLGEVSTLDNYDSYECRNFNGKADAHLSEHGHANALDVHGFGLEGGHEMVLTDRGVPRAVREKILWSMCRRFSTVLGPDSDGYHEDHIHIDLMERHNNYKICEWDVLDPMPEIAPLLPAERPAEAPPRQVAAGPAGPAKPDAAAPPAARPDAASKPHAEGDAPDAAEQAKPQNGAQDKTAATGSTPGKSATSKPAPEPATKKRRSHRRF